MKGQMFLKIETWIEPDGSSATFDLIANDNDLEAFAAEGIESEIGERLAKTLLATVTDILTNGRSLRSSSGSSSRSWPGS